MTKYFVITKQALAVMECSLESAAEIMELDAGDISWAVSRTGRCDTDKHVAIEVESEEQKIEAHLKGQE
jgi:hypothetical protein